MAIDRQSIALIKKECYQAAVKIVDLTTEETNFVKLHQLSTDLSKVLYDAVARHYGTEDPTEPPR